MAIQITRDAMLVVRAPLKFPEKEIERFINAKQEWILKHQHRQLQKQGTKKEFVDGEEYLFLGQKYRLQITPDYSSKVLFDDTFLLSKFQLPYAKKKFEEWYRLHAKKQLTIRAKKYSVIMGVEFKRLAITGAETRWGSCSSQATINFSWKLIMAPEEVVDYVVIHELAHIRHHNHSQAFWNFVEGFDPLWKQHRQWLKDNEHICVL
jgi:predicted metal-dependent hydrolase